MKRIFDNVRAWFKGNKTKTAGTFDSASYVKAKQMSTTSMPTPKEKKEEQIERQYRQYCKAMHRRGTQPRSKSNWMYGKHLLHHAHFGNFRPMNPLPNLHRINKHKVVRLAD